MPSQPTVLHLLGRWKDSQLVFAVPPRPDLWRRRVKEERPYLVVQQLEICRDNDHRHFPNADTTFFPGNENRILPDDYVEPDFYNWAPLVREEALLNWNLEEEMPEVAQEEEDPGFAEPRQRFIRQAPAPAPTPEPLPPNVSDNQVQVSLLLRGGSKKIEIPKVYSVYLNALVQSLASRAIPQVLESFQHIWDEQNRWKVELVTLPAGGLETRDAYKVRFTLPPHALLFFSDVSVMQAMGFDSVGQHWRTDPYGIRASVAKPNQPKTYFWNNNSDRAKTYESVRAVPNWPIYRLRAVAKMERSRLQSTVLDTTPDIENETEELDTTLTLLFDYAKSSPAFLLDSKLNVRFVADPLQRALEFSNFFQQLLRHLADRLGLDPTAMKVEPRENIYVEFKYDKPLSLSLDRFAVKMFFGGRTFRQLEFFDSPALEWNLGRQNPKLFQVLPTEAQLEARRQQAEQQNIEVVNVDRLSGSYFKPVL